MDVFAPRHVVRVVKSCMKGVNDLSGYCNHLDEMWQLGRVLEADFLLLMKISNLYSFLIN